MTGEDAPDVAVVILSTAPDAEEGERLARALVEERLAACVSQVPGVRTLSRWQGTTEATEEILLVIKSHARTAPQVVKRLGELHPYTVPEILVLPVAAGHRGYLDWIREETTQGES